MTNVPEAPSAMVQNDDPEQITSWLISDDDSTSDLDTNETPLSAFDRLPRAVLLIDLSKPNLAQQVFDICVGQIQLELFQAKTDVLCLDGTSCTMKSTILKEINRFTVKTSQYVPAKNPDSLALSMMGLFGAGVMQHRAFLPHLRDRSDVNAVEWSVLWSVLNHHLTVHGTKLSPTLLDQCTDIFETLKSTQMYNHMQSQMNILTIIDSNVSRCRKLQRMRNTGSDFERSEWEFYTPAQNIMYKVLHRGRCIDLDWFGDAPAKDVVDGIAKFVTHVHDYIIARNKASVEKGDPETIKARMIIPMLLPPQDAITDLALQNMTAHMIRSDLRSRLNTDREWISWLPKGFEVYDSKNDELLLNTSKLVRTVPSQQPLAPQLQPSSSIS